MLGSNCLLNKHRLKSWLLVIIVPVYSILFSCESGMVRRSIPVGGEGDIYG